MSDAIKKLHDYLAKSPSVIYPEDVLAYLPAIEAEAERLRELVARVERARRDLCDAYPDAELLNCEVCPAWSECKGDLADRMHELGVEVPNA